MHFDGTAIPPPIFSMYQSIDIGAGIRLGDVNILVPLAVRATAAAWRGVAHMARAVRHSAAMVFSALITLLAAAGVALRVLCCVQCMAM